MTQTISTHTTIQHKSSNMSAEIDNDLVIMSIENGHYYGLNGVGKRIWQLSSTPQTLATICAQLQQEYEIDPQTCESETIAYTNQMIDLRLLEVA